MTVLGVNASDRDSVTTWADLRPAHAGRPAYLIEARERMDQAIAYADQLIEQEFFTSPREPDYAAAQAAQAHALAMERAYRQAWQRWQLERAVELDRLAERGPGEW